MGLFIGLVALIWMGINIVLIFMGFLLPIAVVIIDAFCVVFFLVAMAGTGASGVLQPDSCEFTIYEYTGFSYSYSTTTAPACQAAQAAFAIELFSMLGFILTLVFASFTLHKNKKDLRGKKYAQGLPPISSRDLTSGQPQQQQQQPMEHYMQPIQKMGSPPPQNPQYFEPLQPAPVYSPQQEYPQQPQVYVDSSPQPVHEPISPPISPPPANSLPPIASSANPPPQQLHAP